MEHDDTLLAKERTELETARFKYLQKNTQPGPPVLAEIADKLLDLELKVHHHSLVPGRSTCCLSFLVHIQYALIS